MQRINRIIAFASVSFVLLFIAKINKAGLHTAYFKTLAESGIRNSQDLASLDLLQSQEFSLQVEKRIEPTLTGGSAAAVEESAILYPPCGAISSHYHAEGIFVPLRHFFRAVAPRAPTA